ncbi:MAG: FHA domain-containing protein [Gammaproteobacteria bacterium]|jgi:hypothetical protein|nr:FHA domain-containing protein [Gammaproteobacteria bacterium]MDP6695716.1 FHA domain-containing protein [Gammaproteobacteria bacterium]
MSFLGIQINDVAITGVADGQVVFTEPGCAAVEDGRILFGDAALRLAGKSPRAFFDRYWHELSEKPVATDIDSLSTQVDLAHAQLEHLWAKAGVATDSAGIALPSYWSRDQIALLLGICEEIGIPVEGMAEISVAATRRLYPGHALIHLEMFAHATTLSPVDQADSPSVAQSTLLDNVGVVSLRRGCIEFFAQRFLECSRFDPLHDAESEQQAYDRLDEWLSQSKSADDTEIEFVSADGKHTAQVAAAELTGSLRRYYQPLLQSLRAHLQQDKPTVLQMDPRLMNYPGLVGLLDDLPGCMSFVLESDAAARGLAARQTYLVRQDSGITVSGTLPWDQAPAEVGGGQVSVTDGAAVPSHLVAGNTAYRLGATPLRIGTETLDGEYGLSIDRRHTGVSRRHCGIEVDGGCVVLNDYSRYGTRLNGHKVDGSVVLQVGDVVTLGDPPCELKLIAETGPHGT